MARSSFGARLIAAGFLLAFATSVATVILTGLLVEAPRSELSAALPSIEMSTQAPYRTHLVFTSQAAHDDVVLHLRLPPGVELDGYGDRRDLAWRTQLAAGRNVLPLELNAAEPTRGQLVASLDHDGHELIFRVHVAVTQ